ncbi:hypothetical protein [Actinomadura verrucosospora]|uniref:Secreted protein n=1 Tax=Actinomadura verrucosospora TaxID=46165 RepID=A0A7D3VZM8_ACTVE|nr:hypothetical protein [Actinomadura verrucosospora]QKG26059.1 hypothetical protein ACTIVE_7712 [Actinomadura verrucosospora]
MTAVQQAPAGPPGAPSGAPAGPAVPSAGAAPAERRSTGRLRRDPGAEPAGIARALPRTVAGRVRTLAAAVAVLLVALLVVAWVAVADARDGVKVIGKAGPQVVATGDMYFQLSDMDAQLANALLAGAAPGGGRDQALARYDQDRKAAGVALLKAAKLADETTEDDTARDLLDGLGRYERLASQALLLDQQTGRASGPPPKQVLDLYRQATEMMKLDLLPKAYNLTLDNGTLVRHTYEDKRSDVRSGALWVVVTGIVLLAALLWLQVYLARRFRRVLNPALAVATLGALVLVAACAAMLTGQADDLRRAKEQGFDPILSLSRARAISNSANADETRFLLDPAHADSYEQVYLAKSQTVLYLKAGNLDEYNAAVQKGLAFEPGRAPFLGFLGTEANRTGELDRPVDTGEALGKVLKDYQRVQQNDHRIRQLADAQQHAQAVSARGAAAADFGRYDTDMQALIGIHQAAFKKAIKDGKHGTGGWYAVLPAAGVVIVVLALVGLRPRLAEYRWQR